MSQARPTDHEATKYAESYVLYGDQSRAFRAAFPKCLAKPETIHVKASTIHKTDKVQLRIAELSKALAKESSDTFKVDAAYVMRRITEIDQMDFADILNDDGSILPINQWPKVWRTSVSAVDVMEIAGGGDKAIAVIKKIKRPDVSKNLEMMGKLASVGAFKDHVDHTTNGESINKITITRTIVDPALATPDE